MTGSRGPLPKPAALKALEGNPGKRALDLSGGFNPRVAVPSPPKHLGRAAKKEWIRIGPLLEENGMVSQEDLAALALYCQAYGRQVEYEMAFEGMVHRFMADEKLSYADAVYRASYSVTPSGYAQQAIIIQLIQRAREQVHRFLMHFGLSPASRGRVQPSNYVQPTLPGIEPPGQQPASSFARFAQAPAVH